MGNIFSMVVVNQALEVMWKGMLSIFIVILVLTALVYLINKFTKDKVQEPKD